jgi:4-hydroxybenzoyl-CoA thioesterase
VTASSNTRTVRIEWGDCDPAGIIFYPRYFEIFDASTALLFERRLGLTKFEMLKDLEFGGFPLVRTRARFLRPTRFGEHQLSLNGEICVECSEKRVWVNRDEHGRLKSRPVPAAVLNKFRG